MRGRPDDRAGNVAETREAVKQLVVAGVTDGFVAQVLGKELGL